MPERVLHQFTEGAYLGDAVSDQAFLIRRWLRELGFTSEIYAEKVQTELAGEVRLARDYRPGAVESCLIHHHAVGSDIAERLKGIGLRQILIYHNITPPGFYAASNPALAVQLNKGRQQLAEMRPRTLLALGDSRYNELELQALGFASTGVLPIVLDESNYAFASSAAVAAACRAADPLLLFVGRLAPNKRQEDLIKLLYFVQRPCPRARLVLVGSTQDAAYVTWLREFAASLGLHATAVQFAGHVSQQEMVTYYRAADVYVSMSEHEGFGKPLIESMYLGLPVVAYGVTAVPDTLGGAGILFYEKNYEALAELVTLVSGDKALRERILARQRDRVQAFLAPQVRRQWEAYLRRLDLFP